MSPTSRLQESLSRAKAFIYTSQAAWAAPLGLDAHGWIDPAKAEANLIWPMSEDTRRSFEDGAGSELNGKMRAPHSSSALGYNMFAAADRPALARAIATVLSPDSVPPASYRVAFEVKRRTRWGGLPPHLDVELTAPDRIIAVESKFAETYDEKTAAGATASLGPYLDEGRHAHWADIPKLRDVAQAVSEGALAFEMLDAPQLIKHILGLRRAQSESGESRPFELVLLWYDAGAHDPDAGPACSKLGEEFSTFKAALANEFPLRIVSHQRLFAEYEKHVDSTVHWMEWLRTRYFPSRRAGDR